LFCGLAETYEQLLAARMITGIFGGVIGSIVFAITTDLFPMEMRGRVMGIVQTAFAGSQVLGLPLGLYFSNLWGWHAPFIMIVLIGAAAGVLIMLKLRPIDAHLKLREAGKHSNPFHHLVTTVSNPRYLFAFASMALLSTGGFMIMPFSSAFSVHNVGVPIEQIPMVYMFTGAFSIFAGPIIGRLSDSIGKFKVFCIGSFFSITMLLYYTQMGVSPVWQLILVSVILFMSISARMISASALISGVPAPAHRGSFMSVSSSMQQIAGGISAGISGLIVSESATGGIEHFDRVGYVVTGAMLVMVVMMRSLDRMVKAQAAGASAAQAAPSAMAVVEPVTE
jgi:predicted MFS family arabinose efflux permease